MQEHSISRGDEKGQPSTPSLVLEVHPAALLFPMMSEDELNKLADDIAANGLLEPVVLYHGQILDGRNRLAACELADVAPQFSHVDGDVPFPSLYVLSKNLHRRHLTTSQRAAIAAEVVPLLQEERRKHSLSNLKNQQLVPMSPIGDIENGRSTELAAKELQVGARTVQKAVAVKRDDPEAFERVKSGEISINAAAGEQEKRHKREAVKSNTAPYEPTTPTQVKRAEGQKERMVKALSMINGLCRGLGELNIAVALSVCNEEDRTTWIERARDLASQLRAFAKKLEEVSCLQQQS